MVASKSKPWNMPLRMCSRCVLQQIAGVDLLSRARLRIGLLDHCLRRGVVLQQILHRADQKAAGATGRIADDVSGLWLKHIDHQPDDVPRRAELAVDAGRGQLAEQVLVEIALGVAFGERQLVDHVHGLDQKARLLDHQLRVLHELGEGGAAGRRRFEMRETPYRAPAAASPRRPDA